MKKISKILIVIIITAVFFFILGFYMGFQGGYVEGSKAQFESEGLYYDYITNTYRRNINDLNFNLSNISNGTE